MEEEAAALFLDRVRKLDRLKAAGIDPFAVTRYPRTHLSCQIISRFCELEWKVVRVAGRVTAFRAHGKASFADLMDEGGRIQVLGRLDALGAEAYQLFCDIDLGDIIGVEGTVIKTRTGEITVLATKVMLLSKALLPPPEKWHGLKDVEIRYRQRYLDLIANSQVRNIFVKRSLIIRSIRRFLDEQGFLEVETPMMHSIPGGALARPFVTYHNALDMELYLRIAPELYLKQLIVGGFEKVYEIGRSFRNEGISPRHNPEFTMLEAYQAYVDYETIMELTETLIAHAAKEVLGTMTITYQGNSIDLTPPWRRKPLLSALKEFSGVDFRHVRSDGEAREVARDLGLEVSDSDDRGRVIDELLKKRIAPSLISPTFLLDYPVEISPLAKRKSDDPSLSERFQGFIGGLEVANAFSELNDPLEQRERFEMQMRRREAGDEEAMQMDWEFVRALEHAMPPTGGLGVGIDRLVMLFTDSPSIREVILFPQLRPSSQ